MSVLEKVFTPQVYRATHLVSPLRSGSRLDCFVRDLLPSLSRVQIQRKIRAGDITILGRTGRILPRSKLQGKDRVSIAIRETCHEREWWRGRPLTLERRPTVIFEDDRLVVVSKPPFMSTHPTGLHLFNCVTVCLGQAVRSVHRLDRETSGLLMLGKTREAAQEVGACFAQNRVKKAYLFIAKARRSGTVPDRFVARHRIGVAGVGVRVFPETSGQGKQARTDFILLRRARGYVLGLAFPATGRQHQIRAHAAACGLPLLGDKLYLGSLEVFQRFKDGQAGEADWDLMELPRQALHACALRIDFADKRLNVRAPVPGDLSDWVSANFSISPQELEAAISANIWPSG